MADSRETRALSHLVDDFVIKQRPTPEYTIRIEDRYDAQKKEDLKDTWTTLRDIPATYDDPDPDHKGYWSSVTLPVTQAVDGKNWNFRLAHSVSDTNLQIHIEGKKADQENWGRFAGLSGSTDPTDKAMPFDFHHTYQDWDRVSQTLVLARMIERELPLQHPDAAPKPARRSRAASKKIA